MEKSLFGQILRMKELNATIRHQLEVAELAIPQLNELINALGALDNTTSLALGTILLDSPYTDVELCDSSIVYQAALKVPGGVGVITWDMNEYAELLDSNDPPEPSAQRLFVPFVECTKQLQAALLPHAGVLVEQYLGQFWRHR
jgi:hypothetical protein